MEDQASRRLDAPILTPPRFPVANADPHIEHDGEQATVRGETFSVAIRGGALASWVVGDRELLASPLLPHLWRAPTDNDEIRSWSGQEHKPAGRWRAQGLDVCEISATPLEVERSDRGVILHFATQAVCKAGAIAIDQSLSVFADGMLLDARFDVPEGFHDLPRIGLRAALVPGFESLSFYGEGPHETYPDRRDSGLLAVHHTTVAEAYVPYPVPQEHGHHTGLRWLSLHDDTTRVTVAAVDCAFQGAATHLPHERLESHLHACETEPDAATWLHLDAAMRGVGTASCGPDTQLAYRLGPGRYRLQVALRASAVDDAPL
ncbi:MAG: hypothetical protein ACOC1G_06385 [Phycisphaeraceae bacterium]